ncbi:MSC_0620 family F1-like ATPase-associated subunit [Metamycoplasma gateae]|uniref:Transmembrane protein n=1 Tax=Metamycoplasma gateae TaxID=35769 RepID=A0ABZ2ALL6_9BACT|nr:hypothetical protein V2E26_01360 [Metamycoplasma gateae]
MKLKNKLLSLGLLSLTAFSPLAVISESFDKNQEGENNNNNDQNKPAPKNAENFDEFLNIAKEKVSKAVEQVIDLTIQYLDNEKGKLLKDLDNDFKPNIEKLIYIQVLKQHLEKNKESLKTEHSNNFGFTVVFPYIMSTDKNYNISTVEYDGQTFEDIKVGNVEKTNYSNQIKPDGKITKKGEELNTITKERLEKLIKDYFGALTPELPKMMFNEEDVPKIGEHININFGSWQDNENTINGFSFTHPKEFASWEEYIVSKLHKKFLKFDLEQNKNFVLDEETEKKEDEPINKPDLVPGDKPNKKVETEEDIQALPSLLPNVFFVHTSKTASNLKTYFDNASNEDKNKMFFFNNPINTRYEYSVTSLESKNNTSLVATVKITDRVDTKKSRSYKIEINIDNSKEQEAVNYVYEKIISANKKMFSQMFTALGIDDKINYSKLRNDILRDALYNVVGAGVAVTNFDQYVEKANSLVAKAAEDYLRNGENENSIQNNIQRSKYLLLTSLFSSTINNYDYFYSLSSSLKFVLLRFKEIIKLNSEIIKNNFDENGYDLNVVNQYYDLINKKISRLIASTGSRTLNIFNWYDYYTKTIKEIMDNFATLALMVDNKKLTEKKDQDEFSAAYFQSEGEIKEGKQVGKKSLNQLGYSLLGISAVIALASIIFTSIKRQQLKSAKLKKFSILSISIILALFITSILMIIL